MDQSENPASSLFYASRAINPKIPKIAPGQEHFVYWCGVEIQCLVPVCIFGEQARILAVDQIVYWLRRPTHCCLCDFL